MLGILLMTPLTAVLLQVFCVLFTFCRFCRGTLNNKLEHLSAVKLSADGKVTVEMLKSLVCTLKLINSKECQYQDIIIHKFL